MRHCGGEAQVVEDLPDDRQPLDHGDDLHAWSSHERPGCGRSPRPGSPGDRIPGSSPGGGGGHCLSGR
jgi:hypothetical protein